MRKRKRQHYKVLRKEAHIRRYGSFAETFYPTIVIHPEDLHGH